MKKGIKWIVAGALALVAASAAMGTEAASAAPIKECGYYSYSPSAGYGVYYGVYNITTRIVSCGRARRMARAAYYGRKRLRHGYVRWGSFNCTVTHMGIETDDLRCVRHDGGVVHWQMGA